MYNSVFEIKNLIFILVAIFCAAVTFVLSPVSRALAVKTGAVDIPDKKRKFHRAPTPRLGGVAIAAGFAISSLCGEALLRGGISKNMLITVLGGIAICVLGVLDDIYDLPALFKLAFQICLASVTVFFGGAAETVTVFGRTFALGIFSAPMTALWIVFIINAINLIDGLDGLACGVTFLCSASLLLISVLRGDATCAVISAALCGASVGFLPFNANPAEMFMGDCGATLFGYALACVSVFGCFKGATLISAVAPVLVFAFPAVDVLGAVTLRILKKKNPFGSDRLHFHYELVDIGFSPRMTVMIIYIASAVFCFAGVMSLYYKKEAVILAAMTFLFLFLVKNVGAFIARRAIKTDIVNEPFSPAAGKTRRLEIAGRSAKTKSPLSESKGDVK